MDRENAIIQTFIAQRQFAEAYVVCILGTNEMEVDLPTALTNDPFGIVQDSAAADQSIPVMLSGITKVVAQGAFARGDQLGIAALTGRVDTVVGLDASFSPGTATAQKSIGIALEAATNAGDIVTMLIRPFYYPWG